jgi:UDP-N-acetylmuramoyl-tripeptide--D-alanyl-D-alanine ligase
MTMIEDCYNASPESMRAGLDVLLHTANTKKFRPVAVLGDMRELGSISEQAHKTVGAYAAKVGVQKLVTFGKSATDIAEGAKEAGMSAENIFVIEDTEHAENAVCLLKNILQEGDAVLFKASRAVALERLIRLL